MTLNKTLLLIHSLFHFPFLIQPGTDSPYVSNILILHSGAWILDGLTGPSVVIVYAEFLNLGTTGNMILVKGGLSCAL